MHKQKLSGRGKGFFKKKIRQHVLLTNFQRNISILKQ